MEVDTTDWYHHFPSPNKKEQPSNQILKQILMLGDDCNLHPEMITATFEASSSSSSPNSDLVVHGIEGGSTYTFQDPSFCSPFSSSSMESYSLAALPNGPSSGAPLVAFDYSHNQPNPPLPSPVPAMANLCKILSSELYPCNLNSNGFATSPTPSDEATKLSQISHATQAPTAFEGDGLMTFPDKYYKFEPEMEASTTSSFLDPIGSNIGMFFPGSLQGMLLPGDAEELIPLPNLPDRQTYIGGLDIFPSKQMDHSSPDMQVLDDFQNVIGVSESPTWLSSDMATMSETSFKIGRMSVEERKEKIDRYMKKRSERNFSKKIKYACRKTLADSRPRVKGRFAKNDDFGEASRPISINTHHDEGGGGGEEEEEYQVMIKDEDSLNSSAIFQQLSYFRCNFTLESWI